MPGPPPREAHGLHVLRPFLSSVTIQRAPSRPFRVLPTGSALAYHPRPRGDGSVPAYVFVRSFLQRSMHHGINNSCRHRTFDSDAMSGTRVPPYCAYVQRLAAQSDDEASAFMTMTTFHEHVTADDVVLVACSKKGGSRALQAAMDAATDGYLFRIPNDALRDELTRLAENLLETRGDDVAWVNVLGDRFKTLPDVLRKTASDALARERTKQMELEVEILRLRLELAKASLPATLTF